MLVFLCVSFLLLLFVGVIWSHNDFINILIKMIFIVTMLWNAFFIFKLVPFAVDGSMMHLL